MIPELHTWNEKLITDANYIVISRHGQDHIMDESVAKDYPIPEKFTLIKSKDNLNNMIKSKEVRERIRNARNSDSFFDVGGLVTKSVIEYISQNDLYKE